MTQKKKSRSTAFFHTRLLSIVSIMLTLFILGGVGLAKIGGNQIENQVKEQISFTLLLPQGNSEAQNSEIYSYISKQPFVRSCKFISPENAAQDLEKELGENPVDVLGYNPLQSQIEINLKADYTHPDSLTKVENTLRRWNADAGLTYRQDLLQQVCRNMHTWELILLCVAIIQLIISYIQINNTTRLIIYSKRFQIRTMSLVGATPWFIQRPIVGQSMLDGLLGGLLSVGLWCLCLWAIQIYAFTEIMNYLPSHQLLILAATLVILGILISAFTSWLAARKYIRMNNGKINLI